jgi:hypothetical protein
MNAPSRATKSAKLAVDVVVRRYSGVDECDVIVKSGQREMVVSCPDYERAVAWAQMECRSYRVPFTGAEITA